MQAPSDMEFVHKSPTSWFQNNDLAPLPLISQYPPHLAGSLARVPSFHYQKNGHWSAPSVPVNPEPLLKDYQYRFLTLRSRSIIEARRTATENHYQ
jgi:hypothetical protein